MKGFAFKCLLYLYVIGYFFTGTALAQRETPTSAITFKRIGKSVGIPNTVSDVKKDKLGFIWLSAKSGIYRYDGIRTKVYKHDPAYPNSLSNSDVTALFIDKSDRIWATTLDNKLYRLNRQLNQFIALPLMMDNAPVPNSFKINTLFEDSRGIIWLATNKHGLNRLNPNTGQVVHIDLSSYLPIDYQHITDVAEDKFGNLWCVSFHLFCLYFKKDKPQINYATRYYLTNDPSKHIGRLVIKKIECQSNGNLWAAGYDNSVYEVIPSERKMEQLTLNLSNTTTSRKEVGPDEILNPKTTSQGIIRFDPLDRTASFGKIGAHVNALFSTIDGQLWQGNEVNGINIIPAKSQSFLPLRYNRYDKQSLSSNRVTDIYGDNTGEIWVSTAGGGLNYYHPNLLQFNHFRSVPTVKNTLSSDEVTAFEETADRTIWVGTTNGLNQFNPINGTFKSYYPPATFSNAKQNRLFSILSDESTPNSLWIGSQGGLIRFDTNTGLFSKWRSKQKETLPLEKDYVGQLTRDKKGRLWAVSFLPYRIFRLDKATNTFQPISLHPKNWQLKKIVADNQNHYWIATKDNELYQLDLNTTQFQKVNLPSSIPVTQMTCVWIDKNQAIWIGTNRGLYQLTLQKKAYTVQSFSKKEGLLNDAIMGILEAPNGDLWFSTQGGLSRFNPIDSTFRIYHQADGLQDDFFIENAVYKSASNQQLYFGGINGFNVFHPDKIKEDTLVPSVAITDIQVVRGSSKEALQPQSTSTTPTVHLYALCSTE